MNVIEIKDFSAPELDVFAKLNENQLLNRDKPEKGMFIAESPKVVERALDAGYEPVSMLIERKHIKGEASGIIARCPGIPVYTADYDILTQITGFKLTRGVLCAMKRRKPLSAEAAVKGAKRIAVLESVMNPTNVGAIIRSAAALNMDAVLLTPDCSNPLYRRAIRVSMGTVFQIPWAFLPDGNTAGEIHKLGFKAAAMALRRDSVDIHDEKLKKEEKLAVILGTEGEGLKNETLSECDHIIKIPMTHGVDSLNVAAASAVAFWELGNQ